MERGGGGGYPPLFQCIPACGPWSNSGGLSLLNPVTVGCEMQGPWGSGWTAKWATQARAFPAQFTGERPKRADCRWRRHGAAVDQGSASMPTIDNGTDRKSTPFVLRLSAHLPQRNLNRTKRQRGV